MKSDESGLWFVVKNYPGIVREGLRLTVDDPVVPELRVDPDGIRKREARVRFRRPMHIGTAPEEQSLPPDTYRSPMPHAVRTIHLQWLDASHGSVWRDTDIEIDLETKRLTRVEDWLLGRRRESSGSIGVFVFASPALAALSPYIFARHALWRSRERREGMSRHAVVLMERLAGRLDPETESILREALRKDWTRHRKMTRVVTFDEACAALDSSALEVIHQEADANDGGQESIEEFVWRDDDGDVVGRGRFEGNKPHAMRVLGSRFVGGEAEALTLCARARVETRK